MPDTTSIDLMITYACQLRCVYCQVKQKPVSMKRGVIKDAVDLLHSSRSDFIELRFFGGEPLLRFDLVKEAMEYSQSRIRPSVIARKCRHGRLLGSGRRFIRNGHLFKAFAGGGGQSRPTTSGRSIRYVIVTNGILLDRKKLEYLSKFPVQIMFSIDGSRATHKKYRSGAGPCSSGYQTIMRNLRLLLDSGLDYFADVVVPPEQAPNVDKELDYLAGLGVKQIQVGADFSRIWKPVQIRAFQNSLDSFIGRKCLFEQGKRSPGGLTLMNLYNDADPVMLNTEVVVDCDGRVYMNGAIFAEKVLPGARKAFLIGDVKDLASADGLHLGPEEHYRRWKKACRGQKSKLRIALNAIGMGFEMKHYFQARKKELTDPSEHVLWDKFIKSSFKDQKRIMSRILPNMRSFFLYLRTGCRHDCIFCRNKTVDSYEGIGELRKKMFENRELDHEKLVLIGNEPLEHPEIVQIVAQSRGFGFGKVEVMTSGICLEDLELARTLASSGLTSVAMPLFSTKESEHDYITGSPGSFRSAMKALENLKSIPSVKVHVHTNLIRQNIDRVSELEEFVTRGLELPFCILPVRPKDSNIPYRDLAPAPGQMMEILHVKSLLGFPLCISRKIQGSRIPAGRAIADSMKIYLLDQHFFKPRGCLSCSLASRCMGTFKEFLDIYGDDWLEPVIKVVSGKG